MMGRERERKRLTNLGALEPCDATGSALTVFLAERWAER